MNKIIIKVTEYTALQIEGVKIGDTPRIDLRQMYRVRGDNEWKPTKKGININSDTAKKLRRALSALIEADSSEFRDLEE